MLNPIIQRELISLLRTRKALAVQAAVAVVFAALVILRWPSDPKIDLSGEKAQQVFRVFGYGLLTALILLVPIFPATSIVREKNQGTLALLLNSPMRPWSIYLGKMCGVLGFALLLMISSLPSAAACYCMGGISLSQQLVPLYGILGLVATQYTAVALLVSLRANSTDSAVRITYGLIFVLALLTMAPHYFLQGKVGLYSELAAWLRLASPVPAVMEILGQGDIGSQGLVNAPGAVLGFGVVAAVATVCCMAFSIAQLSHSLLDRARSSGVITDERAQLAQWLRRLLFLVDPQRRKAGIARFVNPVMVKEFRSRRFGRSHWMLRLVALCALISLVLTYATTTSTMDWGVETIGGIMVVLQVALIVLVAPSLAAGLISSERESGGWELLQSTPLAPATILVGKLLSVMWPLMLIMLATLPGYLVMIYIQPALWQQVLHVIICLLLTALLALMLSAAVSSLFRRTAVATTVSYTLLVVLLAGTMLVWLGRDAPFGHATVQRALSINPVAAALSIVEAPGFARYQLVPLNWWLTGTAALALLALLLVQTWRLTRPQ